MTYPRHNLPTTVRCTIFRFNAMADFMLQKHSTDMHSFLKFDRLAALFTIALKASKDMHQYPRGGPYR